MKTQKETSVLIAFEKTTAIWDIKMEDIPQLAVQDLKTTCSKKIKHQHSAHCNSRILHIACHLPHERHTSDVCHLNHDFNTKPYVKAPRYDKTSR